MIAAFICILGLTMAFAMGYAEIGIEIDRWQARVRDEKLARAQAQRQQLADDVAAAVERKR